MILDALTRAEHERQIEKQPKLKFVNPVKQQQKPTRNIWLWVAVALGINALVLAIILQTNSNDEVTEIVASNNLEQVTTPSLAAQTRAEVQTSQINQFNSAEDSLEQATAAQTQQVPAAEYSLQQEFQAPVNEVQSAKNDIDASVADAQPLALESIDSTSIEPLDRPLIYEAKQAKKNKPQQKKPKQESKVAPVENKSNVQANKGAVSFSSTPLSHDDSAPVVTQTPKLLIDQGQSQEANGTPATTAPSLKEIPASSRNKLSQYEVNVHVFDNNPQRRFVLINMNKYKEGQSIANNGPLVEEITREGVIVDYGNGRVLLPPN